jgi:hypothetical protein
VVVLPLVPSARRRSPTSRRWALSAPKLRQL